MSINSVLGGKMKAYFLGDAAGVGVASVAVTSGYWTIYVKDLVASVSNEAVVITPILGGIYMGLQIWALLFRKTKLDE